jgi:hypothetical protein
MNLRVFDGALHSRRFMPEAILFLSESYSCPPIHIGAMAPTIPPLTGRTSHAFIDVVVSRRNRQSCRTRRNAFVLKIASFIHEFSGSRAIG